MTKSTRRFRASYRARNSLLFKVAAVGACLGAMATVNKALSMWAERKHLPKGRFLDVDGVKLHYLDQGSGPVLVFLHGNGSMIDDFTSSGLISEAAKHYRVIAFDRPGFGHSSRPRDTVWTASAQAHLIHRALSQLGVSEFSVFGHSWGASVAIAMGIRHPDHVRSLVLASGYYYPVPMMSMFLLTAPALPLIGDILAHTIAPAISRFLWQGMIAKIFKPAKAPQKFRSFPKSMALRPSQ
ncbi:MAG: alpha/beta hydrolase, partial [Cytophagaceae bacterium]